MNVRETGIRRIRYLTRGLTLVGVAGSLVFAGLAKSATESAQQPAPTPTSPATTDPGTGQPPDIQQPPVRHTDDQPQVTLGGS
jgi:hypothetical protein